MRNNDTTSELFFYTNSWEKKGISHQLPGKNSHSENKSISPAVSSLIAMFHGTLIDGQNTEGNIYISYTLQ